MKLIFLGTRGEIEEFSKKHYFNSSFLVIHKNFKLLVEHGLISTPLKKIKPDAVIISHAHPDHFKWIKKDEDYEGRIFLTRDSKKLSKFKKNFRVIKLNKWFRAGPFHILAFRVVHSLRAPAAGFKIKTGKGKTILYSSDLVAIKNKSVLNDVDLYIGDGSSFNANLVRQKNKKLFGHARMQTQINWCRKYNIRNIIFTHLGKEPLRTGDKNLVKKLKEKNPGLNIKIAYDRMNLRI